MEWACSIFGCECVQCLRGGVRFPNEVGAWWPSVFGGPNPKALHFQPWVGLGLRDRQALHRPHGSLAVHLKYKKTYLTRVFGLRHSICSNPFFRFGSRSQVTNWKGDLAIVFLFWPDFRKYICDLFFLPQVSTCREGKLGGFFFVSLATHPVWG